MTDSAETKANGLTQKDEEARKSIISDIDKNIFIEAGAGSGKTTMLVDRMVAMVESGIDIRKISAITFTRAAANEFYKRFHGTLRMRSTIGSKNRGCSGLLKTPNEETAERCEQALKNIDLCFMGTIDSFCQTILSEHPYEAGIPTGATLIKDAEAEEFYRQQYIKLLNGDHDSECGNLPDGRTLSSLAKTFSSVHYKAADAFVQGMKVMMENRNADFQFDEMWEVEFTEDQQTLCDELRAMVSCLAESADCKYVAEKEQLEGAADNAKKDYANSNKAWGNIEYIKNTVDSNWDDQISNILYVISEIKNLRLDSKRMKEDDIANLEPYTKKWSPKKLDKGLLQIDDKCDLLTSTENQLKEIRYSISMTFFKQCVPVLEKAMRDAGRLTYFDWLYYLRNMLKKDAKENGGELIKYIRKRHRYFLIDEFQDTNPLQAEIFFYLTAENHVEDWTACRPEPGSLFIVGDPKQSIYRFRGADVASFERVKDLFKKEKTGEILELTSNFRSTKELRDYYNDIFPNIIREDLPYQSGFSDIPPNPNDEEKTEITGEETVFSGVFTYVADTREKEADGIKEDEADVTDTDPAKIAEIIKRLVNNEKYMIAEKNSNGLRRISYRDIMIITNQKDTLDPIMEKLMIKGIPIKVEGKVLFAENRALREVYRIYAAVADSKDEIALYGALTGKLIGLTEKDLLNYGAAGGELPLKLSKKEDSEGEEGDEEHAEEQAISLVREKIDILNELYNQTQFLTPASLFSKIIDDFRVFNNVSADDMEVLYYTLELLRNAEQGGTVVTLEDGRDFIKDRLSGESEEERCLSLSKEENRVHLANLHKVKGLEAPIVILAAEDKPKAYPPKIRIVHGNKSRTQNNDGEECGTDNVNRPQGHLFSLEGFTIQTKKFVEQQNDEKTAQTAEISREIYVAATRAKNALIICRTPKSKNRKESAWQPLLDTKDQENTPKDFFAEDEKRTADVPAARQPAADAGCAETGNLETGEKPEESVDPAQLYEQAERECALKDRDNKEKETYAVERPSKWKTKSKLADNDGTGDADDEDQDSGTSQENSRGKTGQGNNWKQSGQEDHGGSDDLSSGKETGSESNTISHVLGTMIHKLLETLVTSSKERGRKFDPKGEKEIIDKLIEEIIDEFCQETDGGASGDPTTEYHDKLWDVTGTMLTGGGYEQENGMPEDIFKELLSADDVFCEVPFCYREEQGSSEVAGPTVWSGTIDVLYRSDDEWHIVDYKTSFDDKDKDEQYENQLTAYKQAFKKLTGNDADVRVYSIPLDK